MCTRADEEQSCREILENTLMMKEAEAKAKEESFSLTIIPGKEGDFSYRGVTKIAYQANFNKTEMEALIDYFLGSFVAEDFIFCNIDIHGGSADMPGAEIAAKLIVLRFEHNQTPEDRRLPHLKPTIPAELETIIGRRQLQHERIDIVKVKTQQSADIVRELTDELMAQGTMEAEAI
ncbi:hypothetical protein niasHT_009664 [Heterodera trifolii]|uniref:Uncharacterized protein n=1 Tax=Heterodera trifolii TaxID=157864 RepID=A0ABD2M0G8_9BILA